jgi:hypothetical protein
VDQQVAVDRRSDPRVALPPAGLRATLRPGCTVLIIDVSPGGALVQVERPLRPGARVHMQIVTTLRTFTLTARVLRCAVWTLHPRDGVTYRGALQFEDRCELFWESDTRTGSRVPGRVVAEVGRAGHVIPADGEFASVRQRGSSK